jgi:hypothetical protein
MLEALYIRLNPFGKATLFAQRRKSKRILAIKDMTAPEMPPLADEQRSQEDIRIRRERNVDRAPSYVETVKETRPLKTIQRHFICRVMRV